MGRPLFSKSYHSTPAVRTEPDSSFLSYESCERWTHWNAFDPDSEEFFENNPVYEAFIDPSINPPSGEEQEQALVVEESISSGSSEGSVSERGSPMAVGSDDPVGMLADAYPSIDWQRFLLAGHSAVDPSVRPVDASTQYTRFSRLPTGGSQGSVRGNRQRSATLTVPPQHYSFISTDNLPRTSNITPISIPARTTTANHPISPASPQPPFIPSTPPSQSQVPLSQVTPSPAPTAAPRILTWSPPQPNSPLTNPSARMSLAHILPTLILVRDVVI